MHSGNHLSTTAEANLCSLPYRLSCKKERMDDSQSIALHLGISRRNASFIAKKDAFLAMKAKKASWLSWLSNVPKMQLGNISASQAEMFFRCSLWKNH